MRMRRRFADGGDVDPNQDIRDYESMRDQVAQQPEDVQQMTHLPAVPQRPVTIEGGLIGKKTIGQADYRAAPALHTMAQTAYDMKTAPFYATPLAPIAGALDATEGVASGDPVQAAMGVLGAPGRAGKAIAAGAAAMTPSDAQASFIGERARNIWKPALDLAKKYAGEGMPDKDNWLFTGWGRDKAGNWKSEIGDQNARIDPKAADAFRNFEPGVKVGDVLQHPPLYDAYPTSYSMKMNDVRSADPNVMGSYDANNDMLHVNRKITDNDKLLDTMLHELQHRHDMRFEGHQPGGSPDLFPDLAAKARDELQLANYASIYNNFLQKHGLEPNMASRDLFADKSPISAPSGWLGYWMKHNPDALAQRQMELLDEINRAPKPFDQYQALVGEQTARLPGERLRMDDMERRHNFPLDMPNGTTMPQYGIISPNHGDAAWSRKRSTFADGGDVVADVHESVSHMAGGGEVIQRALAALGKLHPAGSGYASVPGKPANVVIPGFGKVEARPIQPLTSAADSYMQSIGRPGQHQVSAYPQFDPEMARKYAEAFDALGHRPNDPDVRRAYDALADETLAQYRALKDSGLDMRFLKPGEGDPYAASPSLGYADIVNNGKLHVFPTDQGFGSSDAFGGAGSPMLKRVGRVGDLDNATVNDAFRVVHDVYGHFAPGNPFFRAPGEERAFINHSRMYSPDALPAMATETRGQNSWVNSGPHAEHNATASGADTIYADQKTDIMPDWATKVPGVDDPGKAEGGAIVKRALDALGFYSKAADVAKNMPQGRISTGQLVNKLRGSGVPQAEFDHAGWANETKGMKSMLPGDAADLFEAKKPQLMEKLGDSDHTDFAPQYADPKYKLPGGSNYEERLLHLPWKTSEQGWRFDTQGPNGVWRPSPIMESEEQARQYAAMFPGASRDFRPVVRPDVNSNYVGTHYDDPNIIAHMRMNMRALPDSRFSTHLEELQSDWAQNGRKLGFRHTDEEIAALKDAQERALDRWARDRTPENDAAFNTAYDTFDRARSNFGKIAPGPFVGDTNQWTDLALKRALTVASQNESDAISLTPGVEQAKRWGNNAGLQKFYDNSVQPKLTKMLGQPEMVDRMPVFNLPEETRDSILRNGMPLWGDPDKFADGGEVDPDTDGHLDAVIDEAHAHAQADPSLMDRAMGVISQLNPIGSAEASPLDGAGRLLGQTVKNAQRLAFPKIYGNPAEIAAEAASRTAPESPNLPKLFGTTRSEMSQYVDAPGNMDPRLPGKGVARGSEAVRNIQTPENEQRLLDILAEAGKHPQLHEGMDGWYVMDPLYQKFVSEYGPEQAKKEYDLFNHATSMMSPASDVNTELARGTALYALTKQGRIDDFKKFGAGAGRRGAPADMKDVPGHAYHTTSHFPPFQKYLENGQIMSDKPKVPLYTQASGVPETGVQTSFPVPDSHFSRGIGLADTRTSQDYAKSASMSEAKAIGPWWRDNIAGQMGAESVPMQARLWGTLGHATGVDTAVGAPKLELLADHIAKRAAAHRISPEEMLKALVRGDKFATGGDVEQEDI